MDFSEELNMDAATTTTTTTNNNYHDNDDDDQVNFFTFWLFFFTILIHIYVLNTSRKKFSDNLSFTQSVSLNIC